jgi:hypothetical protein
VLEKKAGEIDRILADYGVPQYHTMDSSLSH